MCKCVIVLLCIGMLGKPNFSKLSNRSFVTVAVTCKAFSYAQMFQVMKSGDMWKTATTNVTLLQLKVLVKWLSVSYLLSLTPHVVNWLCRALKCMFSACLGRFRRVLSSCTHYIFCPTCSLGTWKVWIYKSSLGKAIIFFFVCCKDR